MTNRKKIFVDPVYQSDSNGIKIKESVYTLMSNEDQKRWELYEQLFGTLEFSLSNIRSYFGIDFLVYPSANCSYFSHIIGSWIITHYFINNIILRDIKSNTVVSLQKELWDNNMTEELLVAAMLKYIPIIPFQNLFNKNPFLLKSFGKNIESITFDIISGKGEFYKKIQAIASSKGTQTIHEVLLAFENSNEDFFDLNVLTNLINNNVQIKSLRLLHILLDKLSPSSIDRINRFSFCLGAKPESALTKSVINDIILTNSEEMPVIIDSDGAVSMLKILFDWVSLISIRIEDEFVTAYSYMLNEGLNLLLQHRLIEPIELIGLSDMEFIDLLTKFKETKDLARRILYMKPYEPIVKGSYANIGLDNLKIKLKDFLKMNALSIEDVVITKQFNAEENVKVKDWITIPVITEDARIASLSELNPKLVDYLQKQFSLHSQIFYILFKGYNLPKGVLSKAREFFKEEILPW